MYVYFDIDPLCNQLDKSVKLYRAYNASKVLNPTGKNGKFCMTRGKDFVRDYERLLGSIRRCDQISPKAYSGKLLRVRVRTVNNEYSLIDKLLEVIVG